MLKVTDRETRLLAVMAIITGLVFAVYREEVIGPPLEPLVLATVEMTVALLHWVGIEAVRSATVIAHPDGFAYEVAYSCIGFLPVLFYGAAVLAFPVGWAQRLVGVLIGLPLLLALNFIRLIHLFHIGVSDGAAFAWWHEDVWPGIVRLTIIGLWSAWVWWAEGVRNHLPERPEGCCAPMVPDTLATRGEEKGSGVFS